LINLLFSRHILSQEDLSAKTDKVLRQSQVAPSLLSGAHGPMMRATYATAESLHSSAVGGASSERDEPRYVLTAAQVMEQADFEVKESRAIAHELKTCKAVKEVGGLVNAFRSKGTHQSGLFNGASLSQVNCINACEDWVHEKCRRSARVPMGVLHCSLPRMLSPLYPLADMAVVDRDDASAETRELGAKQMRGAARGRGRAGRR
jgi:hypothetical protein